MSDGSTSERIAQRRRNAVDPETFLLEAGCIEPTDDEEGLRFTPSFAERVDTRLEGVRSAGVGAADVAAIFGVPEGDVADADRSYPAFRIEHTVRSWPAEGAVELDVAVDRALRETTDDWETVPPRQRYRILQSLRSFQDRCLFCDGEISLRDETVDSCCSDVEVVTIECRDCGRRFLEFSPGSVPGT
ncbi:hypothetical protein [Halopiger goleimassiliensis]|uniref:hypothetical protein n=1 Tax=Halopiger goleimassiliensis TaxID=1293048 RepID=UPI00067802DB|nr:hypothetical protein [Halopiger goleimassiliensis]